MMRKTMMTAAALLALCVAGDALALGVNYGVRIGTGSGFDRDDKLGQNASIFPFAIGPAVKFSLPVLEIEANLLYWSTTTTADNTPDLVDNELAIPLIARLSLPVVPLVFDLQLGAGIEPRIHLSTTFDGEDLDQPDRETVMYMPISVGGDLSLGPVSLNLEIRYDYQLTERVKDDDSRIDYLTFFGGFFF